MDMVKIYPQPMVVIEQWVDINYYNIQNNRYMVSNIGNVFDKIKNVYINHVYRQEGYVGVNLWCNDGILRNFFLHRLVAEAFLARDNDQQNIVNHVLGIKDDNEYYNLEWCTQSENALHAIRAGLASLDSAHKRRNPPRDYSKDTELILDDEKAEIICELLVDGYSYKEILEYFNIDTSDFASNNYDKIGNIKRGITFKHISNKYDFGNINYNHSNYTDDQIHTMCKGLQENLSYKEIYESMFDDTYHGSRKNAKFYEFMRKLKNRETCTTITQSYSY